MGIDLANYITNSKILKSVKQMEKNIIAINGGLLIDGNGDLPIKNAVVLIEDSVVKAAGKKEEVKIPNDADIINAKGKTIMPGMIDAHVHLASVVGVSPDPVDAILRTPEPLLLLHAAKHAREMLEAGFTAIRDCVGMKQQNHDNVFLKCAIEMDLIPGPRVITCSWVETTGGHGDAELNMIYAWPIRVDSVCADGPWEIRKRVREAARAGADQIKTGNSGHYLKFGPMGNSGGLVRSFTKEEFLALVDEAHVNGMKVMCHSGGSIEAIMQAIEVGVDTIEHASPLNDEVIQMLVKSKIIIVPTLSIPMRFQKNSARTRAKLAEIGKAHKAGVQIAMGTDTYRNTRDYWGKNAFELQGYVEAGMTEMEAIVSATKTAAEALGLENYVGTIEKGKLADIIIVDGNPLTNIKILQDKEKILYVIKNGDIVVDRINKGGVLLY